MILTILLLVNLMEVIVVVELTKDIALFVNVWNLLAVQMANSKKNSEL